MKSGRRNGERKDASRWRRLLNSLADSVVKMEETDLQREVPNFSEVAQRTKSLLLDTVKDYRQRHLRVALVEYQRQVAAIRSRSIALPESADARRELLAATFTRFPQMQNAFLTVQHREFKNLSDRDVESFLKQLYELGILP